MLAMVKQHHAFSYTLHVYHGSYHGCPGIPTPYQPKLQYHGKQHGSPWEYHGKSPPFIDSADNVILFATHNQSVYMKGLP